MCQRTEAPRAPFVVKILRKLWHCDDENLSGDSREELTLWFTESCCVYCHADRGQTWIQCVCGDVSVADKCSHQYYTPDFIPSTMMFMFQII